MAKPAQHFGRFRFFGAISSLFGTLELLDHLVRVNWPDAAALLYKPADDALELLFFLIVEHKIRVKSLIMRHVLQGLFFRLGIRLFVPKTCGGFR